MKKGKTLILGPCGEIRPLLARRGKDLVHGAVVERAVLPDVEGGEVETENFDDAQQGINVGFDQTTSPDSQETLAQLAQVAFQLGRMTVGSVAVVQHKSASARTFGHRQPGDHQIDELPPRLTRVVVGGLTQCGHEEFRWFLQKNGETHGRAKFLQAAMQHDQPVQPVIIETARGDFGRDERMPVAVAADPCAEAQAR